MKRKKEINDYVKINRAISRKEEMELLGPEFHSKDRAHKSKKLYTRKTKHKGGDIASFSYPFKPLYMKI